MLKCEREPKEDTQTETAPNGKQMTSMSLKYEQIYRRAFERLTQYGSTGSLWASARMSFRSLGTIFPVLG